MRIKTRGPLTPKKRDMLPKALLVTYTEHDIAKNRLLSDSQLVAAYKKVLNRKFTYLAHSSTITGESTQCFLTVDRATKQLGGNRRLGWLLSREKEGTGKNRFAGYSLNPHCVWEHEGQLIETIPAYRGMLFVLDDAVPHCCQLGLNFLDCVEDARRCSFKYDFSRHLIDLEKYERENAKILVNRED